LRLSPEVINIISSFGDPVNSYIVSERRLRPLLALNADQQMAQVKIMLSKEDGSA